MLALGVVRAELPALLWGAAFLGLIGYSLLAVTAAAAARHSNAYRVSVRLERGSCAVGETVAVDIRASRKIRPPAVIVRYGIPLKTADGRRLPILVDPESAGSKSVVAVKRGAYFAENDFLSVRDAFGFFIAERGIAAERGPRLVVVPEARTFPFVPEPWAGGEAHREEPRLARTEELTESRRYLPGDDPRRINWKVYGHSGELFIRDGDPEPPPRSRYAVLVDSSVDTGVFSQHDGDDAVDALASLALGLVAELRAVGLEAEFGFAGAAFASGDDLSAARYLAGIARCDLAAAPNLPSPDDPGTRIVLLALPRDPEATENTALDRFLSARQTAAASPVLLFVNWSGADVAGTKRSRAARLLFREQADERTSRPADSGRLSALADSCIAAYTGKGGARARRLEA